MNVNENPSECLPAAVSRDDFAAQLNTKFCFEQPPNKFSGELIEVSPLKKSARTEAFSLLFQMPPEFAPLQGNYAFEHEKFGAGEIFIVPIESNADGSVFEAVFNCLSKQN